MRRIKNELPLDRMLDAIGNPKQLQRELQGIDGAFDVKDFLRQAAMVVGKNQDKIECFLDLSLSNCLSDIPYEVAKSGGANISDVRDTLKRVKVNLASDLRRQAEKLSTNPDWSPRRENGSGRRRFGDATSDTSGNCQIDSFMR